MSTTEDTEFDLLERRVRKQILQISGYASRLGCKVSALELELQHLRGETTRQLAQQEARLVSRIARLKRQVKELEG